MCIHYPTFSPFNKPKKIIMNECFFFFLYHTLSTLLQLPPLLPPCSPLPPLATDRCSPASCPVSCRAAAVAQPAAHVWGKTDAIPLALRTLAATRTVAPHRLQGFGPERGPLSREAACLFAAWICVVCVFFFFSFFWLLLLGDAALPFVLPTVSRPSSEGSALRARDQSGRRSCRAC